MINNRGLCSWSGGKDSCFALIQAIREGYHPAVLLNVLNEEGEISRSHGIPASILKQQADAANLPIKMISSSWVEYQEKFTNALVALKEEYNITHAIFGDIDLQAHRDWEEMVCKKAGLTAVLPLWQQDRKALVIEMIDAGVHAMIVSCNGAMGEEYLGQQVTKELVEQLEKEGIDPCGENGEYHTLVTNCSLFSYPLDIQMTGKAEKERYWFAGMTAS